MKKMIFSIALLLVSGIFTLSMAQGPNAERGTKGPAKGYKVGDQADDFKLQNVDGELYSLSDLDKAKGYIVVFTSNECPFAVMYQDRLIDLHNKMAPKGYPVVAINSNDEEIEAGDSFDHMKVRAQEKGFPFLYLKDIKQEVYPKYGATKTPHVFLLDKDRVVQYIGAIDDNAKSPEDVEVKYVENAIHALENGTLPQPNYTKAVGCPIKSKNGMQAKGERRRGDRRGPPSPDMIMEKMDSDNDGKVSESEAGGPLKNDFNSLDANKDGYLTIQELSKMKKGR